MNTASQVPSGVFTSTLVSTTGNSAADAGPVAAAMPAASDKATKSRRDRSLGASSSLSLSFLSSVIARLLFWSIDKGAFARKRLFETPAALDCRSFRQVRRVQIPVPSDGASIPRPGRTQEHCGRLGQRERDERIAQL